jgi:hypothetical protein
VCYLLGDNQSRSASALSLFKHATAVLHRKADREIFRRTVATDGARDTFKTVKP